VTAVENGRLAADHLRPANAPRLALLDWVMPELDGPGVCREVRKRKEQSYVYMILLTSKESKEDVVAGLESGADDYLTKPFDPEELKARLRTGLRILDLEDRLVPSPGGDALPGHSRRADRSLESQHDHGSARTRACPFPARAGFHFNSYVRSGSLQKSERYLRSSLRR